MSKNIDQVFVANPITSNAGTDLMYFGQSPYGPTNDAAMTYTNFSAQFLLNAANSIKTTNITDANVTYAKIQNITAGKLLGSISASAAAPGEITVGTGLSLSAGTLTATGGSGFTWHDVTGTTQAMVSGNGYVADNASLVTMTLPSTAAFGDIMEVAGGTSGTGLWSIAQNSGQNIIINGVSTTVGVSGSVAANSQYSTIRLLCVVANTTFVSLSGVGSYTVT